MAKKYVVGFLFSDERNRIALILKSRPEWQAGLWNGIGGKIETFKARTAGGQDVLREESPLMAMVREFKEETGVELYEWEHFATTRGFGGYSADDVNGWEVHYFRAFDSDALNNVRWLTDELVAVHLVSELPSIKQVLHNDWLIPMALSSPKGRIHTLEEIEEHTNHAR